jgi:flagellar biosynthesis/type III secretory pathway M-ring protein FliF/YscJ
MGAVGYAAARGDEVTVVEMPFDTSSLERERVLLDQPASAGFGQRLAGGPIVAVLALVVIALAMVIVLRLRPSVARRPLDVTLTEALSGARGALEAPGETGPIVPDELIRATKAREDIRQKALTLAQTQPDAVAQVLRAWIVKKKTAQPVAGERDGN